MKVKYGQASRLLEKYILAKIVPFLHSSPGIGKSSMVKAFAIKYNLLLIDKRLAQEDPVDMKGYPSVVNGRSTYLAFDDIPIEGDELPINPETGRRYDGWLLFLDEMNQAPQAVQAAAYKIILDRMVGNKHLHKRVLMAAAGNLLTDNAIVNEMGTALQTRLGHIHLTHDLEEWLDSFAYPIGISRHITSYLQYKPEKLYDFKPDHTDFTFACNRTWEFADRIIKTTKDDDPDRAALFAGVISEGTALELVQFIKIADQLPAMSDILARPDTIAIPDAPDILFSLCGAVAEFGKESNMEKLAKFVRRFPPEFQVVCLREIVHKDPSMMANEHIQDWMEKSGKKLF